MLFQTAIVFMINVMVIAIALQALVKSNTAANFGRILVYILTIVLLLGTVFITVFALSCLFAEVTDMDNFACTLSRI